MLIILPDDDDGLPDLEKKLETTYYNTIVNSWIQADVKLYLPKYKIESEFSLTKPLEDLGVIRAFARDADFSLIDAEKNTRLSSITQKTFIEIDEERTEAAAVTTNELTPGAMKNPPPPPPTRKVDIDHAFLFLIIDNRTQGIVFMGRYAQVQ